MDSRSRLSTILWTLAAVIIPSAPIQAQQGTITGQVTDAETGEPLAGAAVEALGQPGLQGTNDMGRFSLSVPPGTHSVVVSFIGHETTRVDGVSVAAGETTELLISMRSQPPGARRRPSTRRLQSPRSRPLRLPATPPPRSPTT